MEQFIHVIDSESKLVREQFAENHVDFSIDGVAILPQAIFAEEQRFA